MYPLVLSLHSWLRWVVILAGLIALVRAIAGWSPLRGAAEPKPESGVEKVTALRRRRKPEDPR